MELFLDPPGRPRSTFGYRSSSLASATQEPSFGAGAVASRERLHQMAIHRPRKVSSTHRLDRLTCGKVPREAGRHPLQPHSRHSLPAARAPSSRWPGPDQISCSAKSSGRLQASCLIRFARGSYKWVMRNWVRFVIFPFTPLNANPGETFRPVVPDHLRVGHDPGGLEVPGLQHLDRLELVEVRVEAGAPELQVAGARPDLV